MTEFKYEPLFQLSSDSTEYEKISQVGVLEVRLGDETFLKVAPTAIEQLTERAFSDVSHLLRGKHLEKLEKILKDSEASDNDRYVASELLKNAIIAAEGVFPSCQDTGTASIVAFKGDHVLTDSHDSEAISKGVFNTYQKKNLRYSQMAALSMFEEKNTATNLPAQIDIFSKSGSEYHFLFVAKGGGSANKFYLYQKTKALLNPTAMEAFVKDALGSLGTAACPPYHLAITVGGLSAEQNLKTTKMASTGYYDSLPTEGNILGRAFRDLDMEAKVEEWARATKIGAQFGGKYFVHDVRVVRLPRHGASCPVSIGVSCSADRNIKGKITKDGIFVEKLERHPEQYLPDSESRKAVTSGKSISIDLNQPVKDILAVLTKLPVATRVMLNGPIIVARDVAHARLKDMLDKGQPLPDYFKKYAVYYAGPAKTPEGHASGSFGPTTSERMDPYVPSFQKAGASMIMLGKGNRNPVVTDACKQYGGFYLGSIGGPAARLGKDCITKVEQLDFKDLGMEAIWKIEVKDFPAFIIIDDKGNDFFKSAGRH
jgi:fumarate hydratase class I